MNFDLSISILAFFVCKGFRVPCVVDMPKSAVESAFSDKEITRSLGQSN